MKSQTRIRLLAGSSHALLLTLTIASSARAEAAGAADTAASPASSAAGASAAAAPSSASVSEVLVRGKRERLSAAKVQLQSVGPLGNRPLLETPMSISTVDASQIGRIAATTIDAAFSYDASLRTNNSGVSSGNTFASRGQTVDLTFGYRYDGLAFPYWFQDQPIESLDSIQVLKGTGGFVYGYASPAGIVNFVSKKPTSEFQSLFDLSIRSGNIWRALVDVGGPFTEGGSTAFRLNLVDEQGKLYNGAYNVDRFASLYLQGDFTPKLSWSLNGFYQRTYQAHESNSLSIGSNAAGVLVTYLKPVDGAKLNLGSPSSTKQNDVGQLTGRLNYQIAPDWKASAALRYAVLDERFPGNGSVITDNQGDYKLGLLDQNRIFYYYVAQFTVDGNFNVGPIKNNFIAGLDYLNDIFDYDYQSYTSSHIPTTSYGPFGGVYYTGNIYNGQNSAPSWSNNPAALAYERPPNWSPKYQVIQEKGIYISDTLTYDRVELLLGGRYTFYNEWDRSFTYLNGAGQVSGPLPAGVTDPAVTRVDTFTPVIAPSIRIVDGVRAYVSYVQALQTGAIVAAPYLNEGQVLAPLKSSQWEVGVKAQRANWSATLAAFRATEPSDVPVGPAGSSASQQTYEEAGKARYEGIEFNGDYRVNREWLLNASFAHLDAIQVQAPAIAATPAGSDIPGTVGYRAAAFVEYSPDWSRGLTAFGGVRYTSQARAQANNTFHFPAVTVGDLGVNYQLPTARNITVRANIQNVTDVKYWIPNGTAGISAGAPRTFAVSVAFRDGPGRGAEGGGGSTPFNSAYGDWYLGLEGGGVLPGTENYALRSNYVSDAPRGEISVKRDIGGDISGSIGRDFGLFRTEFETNYSWGDLKQVTLHNPDAGSIPINANGGLTSGQVSASGTTIGALQGAASASGTYASPGGSTTVVAFLVNGLLNLKGGASSPWSFEAGGGVGMGVVRSNNKWRLSDNGGPFFQSDSATGFAWQALARVRRKLTRHIDATLSYHYLDIPGVTLRTGNGNLLKGAVAENGLRAGVAYNF